MVALRRKPLALIPNCRTLETRLAPSGNFLSHGLADVTSEVKRLEKHHPAEHSTGHMAPTGHEHGHAPVAHGHHVMAGTMIPATN